MLLTKIKMVESLLFIGAGAGVGAGEKIPGAGHGPAPQHCSRGVVSCNIPVL